VNPDASYAVTILALQCFDAGRPDLAPLRWSVMVALALDIE